MISFLPELPAPPASSLPLPAQAAGGTGTPLDFAGLLDAAMPAQAVIGPETVLPGSALPALPGETPLPPFPAGLRALAEPAPGAGPQAVMIPASAPLPSGTNLPETGEALPLLAPQQLPVAAPVTPLVAEAPGTPAEQPEDETQDSIAPEPAAAVLPVAPVMLATPPAPPPAPLPPAAQPPAAPPAAAPPPATSFAVRAAPAPRASLLQSKVPQSEVPQSPLVLPPVSGEALASATPLAAPAQAAFLSEIAEAAPSAAAPTQQAAAPAIAPTTLTPPVPTERAEPRSPAPNQESTIAQVGEIREALRSVRPEMTLRHAEFGLVSLRIEGAASQDPRAVLASRDPGFIPAVQAALADRAVAAAADTANTGSHTGSGSGSGSDQRSYGFSQGSGQGSSQPYLEQSGKRDEGASQHQRQQHRHADEAASAGATEASPGDAREQGLFA